MNNPFSITKTLYEKANALVAAAQAAHPGMREVAAMVYVGDVYALRVQRLPAKNDGWANRHSMHDTPWQN